jgi:gliding motility-associated-like protein
VITTTTLLRSDTTRLSRTTCDRTQAGVNIQPLKNRAGCDSLVITTTTLLRSDTTRLSRTTCDRTQAGVNIQPLKNRAGCDSLVITTTTLLRSDTTRLSRTTCNPLLVGNNMQHLRNRFGCDSLVLTAITFDPTGRDTTRLQLRTCDPLQAGTQVRSLTNSLGCDSVVITITVLSPRDTLRLQRRSCDPLQAGLSTQKLVNRFGCDSIVITNTILSRTDTVRLTRVTCIPEQAVTTIQKLVNQFGCDSVIIATAIFDPAGRDTTLLTAFSCDRTQAGITQKTLKNRGNCDSLVITTTLYAPPDTMRVQATTCDRLQAGTTIEKYNNALGCDSVVITTTSLLRVDTIRLARTTCVPAQAGVTTAMFTNRVGCDSLVVTTTTLLRSDTTRLTMATCNAAQAGTVITRRLFNNAGCDSLVFITNTYDAVRCAPQIAVEARPATCSDRSDGIALIRATNGEPPFQYSWTNSNGAAGNGEITALNTPVSVLNLPPGDFKVTITANGGATVTSTVNIPAPGKMTVDANAVLKAPPYSVRCAGDSEAGTAVLVSGGSSSYTYSWSNNATTQNLSNVLPGLYTVTVTDENRCSATASVELKAPPPVELQVQVLTPLCGAVATDAFIQTDGGAAPYIIRVNGNFAGNGVILLRAGSNTIEVTDGNGCTTDTTVQVVIPPVISLQLPRDTSVRLGQELTLTALTNLTTASIDTIIWSPLPDTSRVGTLTQVWTPLKSNVYRLTLTDTSNCLVSTSIRVNVRREADIYVPNVFTPNGDGKNDLFTVNSSDNVTDLELVRIFDRWGNMVYEWEGRVVPKFWPGWDGKMGDSKDVGVGVYVYYLRARLTDGEIIFKEGDVTVAK